MSFREDSNPSPPCHSAQCLSPRRREAGIRSPSCHSPTFVRAGTVETGIHLPPVFPSQCLSPRRRGAGIHLHGKILQRESILLFQPFLQISPFRIFLINQINFPLPVPLLHLLLALNRPLNIICRLKPN